MEEIHFWAQLPRKSYRLHKELCLGMTPQTSVRPELVLTRSLSAPNPPDPARRVMKPMSNRMPVRLHVCVCVCEPEHAPGECGHCLVGEGARGCPSEGSAFPADRWGWRRETRPHAHVVVGSSRGASALVWSDRRTHLKIEETRVLTELWLRAEGVGVRITRTRMAPSWKPSPTKSILSHLITY